MLMMTTNNPKRPDLTELNKALYVVEQDVKADIHEHEQALGKKPFPGRTQEEHDQYHQHYLDEAITVLGWIRVRFMRINPD
jgi:hypothetical protein